VYDLPVVETTGYITLSLRDREEVDLKITETTELNILSKYLNSRRSRLNSSYRKLYLRNAGLQTGIFSKGTPDSSLALMVN
jgi:hypothetical protein